MKKMLIKFNLLLCVYLLIFTPPIPFTTINPLHILGFISWVFIFFNKNLLLKIFVYNKIFRFFMILIFFNVYVFTIIIINQQNLLNEISFLLWIFDVFPTALMICMVLIKNGYNFSYLLKIILYASIVNSVLAISAFLIPEIHSYFISSMINYGYSDSGNLAVFRLYGFASNLTFTQPVFQMLVSSICLFFVFEKKYVFIFLSALTFVSAIINARISIILFFLGLLSLIIHLLNKKMINVFFIFFSILGVFLISNFIPLNQLLQTRITFSWINDGFNEILLFLDGQSNETLYFKYLLNPIRYQLPENFFSILFGVGTRAYSGNEFGLSSDLGFVNDIWLGGFIYTILLYYFFYFILREILKIINYSFKLRPFLPLLLVSVLFFSNIKGILFAENDVTNSLFLLLPFSLLKRSF